MKQKQARKLGYILYEGSYYDTNNDVAGRWYWGREGETVDMSGRGFATKKEALRSLEENLAATRQLEKAGEALEGLARRSANCHPI